MRLRYGRRRAVQAHWKMNSWPCSTTSRTTLRWRRMKSFPDLSSWSVHTPKTGTETLDWRPMRESQRSTRSRCNTCLGDVLAEVVITGGEVVLEKACSAHGFLPLTRSTGRFSTTYYFRVNRRLWPQRDFAVRMTERCNHSCSACLVKDTERELASLWIWCTPGDARIGPRHQSGPSGSRHPSNGPGGVDTHGVGHRGTSLHCIPMARACRPRLRSANS